MCRQPFFLYVTLCFTLLLAACAPDKPSPTSVTIVRSPAAPVTVFPMPTLGQSPITTPPVATLKDGKLKDALPELANLAQANSFQITRIFPGGPVNTPPSLEIFLLERQGNFYVGKGNITTGSKGNPLFQQPLSATIPVNAGQSFLQGLSELVIYEGAYRGRPVTTVTHPGTRLEITIFTANGQISFYSNRFGPDNYWTIWYAGSEYNTQEDAPYNAYKLIADYIDTTNIFYDLRGQYYRASEATASALTPKK